MQRHLALAPHAIPQPRDLDAQALMHCRNWREAVRVGIRFSFYIQTEAQLAAELGMTPSNLSRVLNKTGSRLRYFDADRFREVEQLLGNRCISQFFKLESKGLLVVDRELSEAEKARAYDALMREQA